MNLKELEQALRQRDGFRALLWKAEDFRDFDKGKPVDGTGRQQIYTLVLKDEKGVIKPQRVDVWVTGKNTPEETAELCAPMDTPFRDEIMSKVPAYLNAHPEVEKVTLDSCNEVNRIARLTAYEYDVGTDQAREVKKVVYEVDGTLTVRDFVPFTREV